MYLTFDTTIAKLVGAKAATIYDKLLITYQYNKSHGHYFREGKTWVAITLDDLQKILGYSMSIGEIRVALNKLISAKLITKSHLAPDRFDRTTWYTVEVIA